MAGRHVLAIAVLLAWAVPAQAEGSDARLPRELVLHADAQTANVGAIEIGYENLREATLSTAPITDVLLRLKPVHRPTGRQSRSGQAPADTFVDAQLLIVTGGRINTDGRAQCRGFEADVLVCHVDCDGGVFGLRRGAAGQHYLIVGFRPEDGPGGRSGFRMGACGGRHGEGRGVLVLPRAGRLSAEVSLFEVTP